MFFNCFLLSVSTSATFHWGTGLCVPLPTSAFVYLHRRECLGLALFSLRHWCLSSFLRYFIWTGAKTNPRDLSVWWGDEQVCPQRSWSLSALEPVAVIPLGFHKKLQWNCLHVRLWFVSQSVTQGKSGMSHLSLAKRREKVVKKGRRWYGWMDGGGLNFSSSHGQQMAQISGVSLSLPYPHRRLQWWMGHLISPRLRVLLECICSSWNTKTTLRQTDCHELVSVNSL